MDPLLQSVPATMNDYEARRLQQIAKNKALVKELGIQRTKQEQSERKERPAKRQKTSINALPSRTSNRLSTAPKPQYNENALFKKPPRPQIPKRKAARSGIRKGTRSRLAEESTDPPIEVKGTKSPTPELDDLRASWSAWTPSAPEPTRDAITHTFDFPDAPDFKPNKSPEEMMREGCFGGSYFRPLYSRALATTISDDWKELPKSWVDGLDIGKYLTSPTYDPDINKYKVQAGLPIEEWEASGWVNHTFDVRGWFQWYCRFYMGRRCADDERQIRRWRNCVGETGRWRLSLLRKYVKEGVRSVFDEEGDEGAEVSPVQHQTCHHWAFEVRQEVLDEFWGRVR